MNVPQFAPYLGQDEYSAIKECFDNNWITEGPKSAQFGEELCRFVGARYGVFAPNGTLALYLGLKAAGVHGGDEVIVPDCTFIGSANAVEMLGAVPVFVDVKKTNFQIDVEDCRRVLSERTRAIMPVHLFGMSAGMDEVTRFAKAHNLLVIEDAAQALGVRYKGKACGTFGDVGCYSFFADKTITTGEGGFVVTDREEVFHRLLFLRNQGRRERGTFIHPEIGYNFRLTDIQSAMGLIQLRKISFIKERKLEILRTYHSLLDSVGEVCFTDLEPGSDHIPFRVTVLCKKAHALMEFMSARGIQNRTFFYPLHRQRCYVNLSHPQHRAGGLDDRFFPNAIYGYDHGICLPTFPSLKAEQIRYVCDVIKEFFAGNSCARGE